MAATSAALDAYRGYGQAGRLDPADFYALKLALWLGTWRHDPRVRAWSRAYPAVYRNTVQLWRQLSAVVDLYAQFVYPDDAGTAGRALPDGSRPVIPLAPATGNDASDTALLVAWNEMLTIWQYQQYKSLRPKTAAIMGDCLTELIDDYARGVTLPRTIDPRYVTDLELDSVGNVKAYTLEYAVTQPASRAYGRETRAESYRFRKEVDGEAFRFFRDDKPFDYSGEGAVIRNPYGFAPAVWDRHEIVVGSDRGLSATEKTLAQTMQLNSVLSHAMDYQRKQFSAPIGIVGGPTAPRSGRFSLGPQPAPETATDDDIEALGRAAAENLDLLPLRENSQFLTVSFDVGKTTEMLGLVMDSILAENPEARYGQEILTMTQVTAPGVERALSPIVGKVTAAQNNADPQTIKLGQMAIAILGFRVNQGDVPADLIAARPARYAAFAPFDLDSFGRGLLDATIPSRSMFTPSRGERLQEVVLLGQVVETGDPYLMAEAGVPHDEIARIVGEREQRRAEMAAAFSVASSGNSSTAEATSETAGERGAGNFEPAEVA